MSGNATVETKGTTDGVFTFKRTALAGGERACKNVVRAYANRRFGRSVVFYLESTDLSRLATLERHARPARS